MIDQLHCAPAEDERWPNEHRIADPFRDRDRFLLARGGAARRLAQTEPVEHLGKEFAVFRQLDAFRLRADDRDASRFQSGGKIERRLSTELHDHALRLFLFVDVEHVFVRQRLEIKFVARVVVGRNRLRVRVDHDRLEPQLAQGESGVDAAVVELDALADAIRPAAENHDLAFRVGAILVLVAVGGVVIRRVSFEFRRAGVDEAIGGDDAGGDALRADFFSLTPNECASWRSEKPRRLKRRNSGIPPDGSSGRLEPGHPVHPCKHQHLARSSKTNIAFRSDVPSQD